MQYPTMTQAKLAQRYQITAPAMRKALLEKGLTDPETGRPTKEGHLYGGAVYIERNVDGVPQRWPAWHVKTIDELLPDLSARTYGIPTTFKDRFKAMDALILAGHEICDAFSHKAIDADPNLQWLEFAPGHSSLMMMDSPKDRKDWATKALKPLRDHVHQRVKRLRKNKRGKAEQGIERIDGVIHWLTGGKPPPIDVGSPLPPHSFSITTYDPLTPKFARHIVHANRNDITVLTSGWVFKGEGRSPHEKLAYSAIMDPIHALKTKRMMCNPVQRMWITKFEDRYYLLCLFGIHGKEEWFGMALPLTFTDTDIIVYHEPHMTCTLPIIDKRPVVHDLVGPIELAHRIIAVDPEY